MNDFEKELELISQEAGDEPEVKLPSLEEQQEIVAELKKLEAEGKLTPEILEQYFGKFNQKSSVPVH
ncbi:restriction endonuclease subunit S [Vibrio owensii]|uniref:Chromosome segregation ATPase n=2 Tax=Vibrio owensii TaxID=696485 RepID=A0AAP9KDE5_9VIBR|nr:MULTISPECIES: chromosome segregation ATPase [Vibrio]GAK22540.1 chromosome segregation ATPase [Vibrio sp. JCM 19052]HDM8222453.1 restriction endonuclease subunit S [Vibrio campbellii]AQW59978.1 chromosome partitioning protein ParA [Vibrio owensii]AYO16570.1 restriction endonuclease subunit S [Vibrio owensii]AYO22543.1 restriction endonuclease subunit S [Vibrio owensii]